MKRLMRAGIVATFALLGCSTAEENPAGSSCTYFECQLGASSRHDQAGMKFRATGSGPTSF